VGCEATDCFRREDVGIDHMASEVRHESNRRGNGLIVPSQFLTLVFPFF
jgi:hypothetical protein